MLKLNDIFVADVLKNFCFPPELIHIFAIEILPLDNLYNYVTSLIYLPLAIIFIKSRCKKARKLRQKYDSFAHIKFFL